MYKRVKEWNKQYDNGQLDLYKAAESLKAWIGHAKTGDNFRYIRKIKRKCKWYYIEGDQEC